MLGRKGGVAHVVMVGESNFFESTLVSQLNGNHSLSKDMLTRIKAGILYMKPRLLSVGNHDTLLKLGCDCGVCFTNTLEAKIVKKRGRPKKSILVKIWFVGRVYTLYRIRRK